MYIHIYIYSDSTCSYDNALNMNTNTSALLLHCLRQNLSSHSPCLAVRKRHILHVTTSSDSLTIFTESLGDFYTMQDKNRQCPKAGNYWAVMTAGDFIIHLSLKESHTEECGMTPVYAAVVQLGPEPSTSRASVFSTCKNIQSQEGAKYSQDRYEKLQVELCNTSAIYRKCFFNFYIVLIYLFPLWLIVIIPQMTCD